MNLPLTADQSLIITFKQCNKTLGLDKTFLSTVDKLELNSSAVVERHCFSVKKGLK
jgi:hypothetical protein